MIHILKISLFGIRMIVALVFSLLIPTHALCDNPGTLSVTKHIAGGEGHDYATEIELLDSKQLLIAGTTFSEKFDDVRETARIGSGGAGDIYLALVDREKLQIIRLLIVGGSKAEQLHSMVVSPSGNIYVAGSTFSNDFPHDRKIGSVNSPDKTDIFLLKVDKSLGNLITSLVIGGSNYDYPGALHLGSNILYLGGHTASVDFSIHSSAYSSQLYSAEPPGIYSYGFDAFVMALNPDLSKVTSSTLLSGESDEFITGIDEDNQGRVVVIGSSPSLKFLGRNIDPAEFSGVNLFAVRLNAGLTDLLDSFLYRPTNLLYPKDIAVDVDGSVWVTGYCTDGTLKTTPNALWSRYRGGLYDGFVIRLSSKLDRVAAATYFGGNNNDFAQSIVLSGNGNVTVSGFTDSFDDFPTTLNANSDFFNFGHYDTFLSELSYDLGTINYSVVSGSSGYDYSYAVSKSKREYFMGGHCAGRGDKNRVLIQKITRPLQ